MNLGRIKAAAEYVGGVLIATFFVVLLSYIFSFLGTIFCAALGGMMLGALPTRRWQAIPISLIFPLVIFGLLAGMKSGLPARQMVVITVACFSAFWLAYVAARALFFLERAKPGQQAAEVQSPPALVPVAVEAPMLAAAVSRGESCDTPGLLSLDMLQGDWSRDIAQGRSEHRRLCFEKEKLTLSVVDGSEHVRVLARVTVKLCASESLPVLLISKAEAQSGNNGGRQFVRAEPLVQADQQKSPGRCPG